MHLRRWLHLLRRPGQLRGKGLITAAAAGAGAGAESVAEAVVITGGNQRHLMIENYDADSGTSVGLVQLWPVEVPAPVAGTGTPAKAVRRRGLITGAGVEAGAESQPVRSADGTRER